ncbi:MAG: septum formation initiator family protein [Candidatus Saccharimonadales bacterium]
MLDKIKNFLEHPRFRDLKDTRMLGFGVFLILVLLASWSGVNVIQTNYGLQKQIAQMQQQNKLSELSNTNLKLQNEFYKTDTYLELQARKQFGKGAAGETLLLIPRDVALSHAPSLPYKKVATADKAHRKPFYQKNFEAWMSFIFRSGPVNN